MGIPRYDIRATGTLNAALVDVLAPLPAGTNNIGDVNIATAPVAGAHANAWNAAAVLAGGVSAALDAQYSPFVSAFGSVSAATTITLQVSQNNTNWYDTQITQVLAGAGDFCLNAMLGARYARLKSSAAATITATIAAIA